MFDDGDKRSGVSAACIRAPKVAEDARSVASAPSSAADAVDAKPAFAVGQKITAKVGKVGRNIWVGCANVLESRIFLTFHLRSMVVEKVLPRLDCEGER